MYLIAIGWLYVALMMGVAEATNSNGTVLGGIISFVLYGLCPVGLVLYLMGSPLRRKKIKANEAAELAQYKAQIQAQAQAEHALVSGQPDAGSEAPTDTAIAAVRKEA
jgi:hypothetical protein